MPKNTKKGSPAGLPLVAKAGTPAAAVKPPPTWYFPTSDPDVVIACDYNSDDDLYDLNCRKMKIGDVPKHVKTAIVKCR